MSIRLRFLWVVLANGLLFFRSPTESALARGGAFLVGKFLTLAPERLSALSTLAIQLCVGAFNLWAVKELVLKLRSAEGSLRVEASLYAAVAALGLLGNLAVVTLLVFLWISND